MANTPSKETTRKKVAIACQGGGPHAAFEVGVLTEILKCLEPEDSRKVRSCPG